MTSSVLTAPTWAPAPQGPVCLADLAEIVTDLHGFSPALVREIAARMPVHDGPFSMMSAHAIARIGARHDTLGTLTVSAHLLLHLLHAGTGSHPLAIADLYAADRERPGMNRPPLLALLLLAPSPALARAWATQPPPVTVVEDALDRWQAPTLIDIATALALADQPAILSLDD